MNKPGYGSIFAIASGKGGVGKTGFTINLAAALAKQGKKVLVFDGDTGLANLDVQLNLKPERDLADALERNMPLAELITPTPYGFAFIAGRSGHNGLANLPQGRLTALLNELRDLAQTYDAILLDVAAGIAPQALLLSAQADATLLLTTPDPSSLTDAYALLKVLWQTHGVVNSLLVVNQASATEAKQVHTRLTTAVENFLKLPPLPHLATLPHDASYAQAVRLHKLAFQAFPNSAAVKAVEDLATRLPKPRLRQSA